MAYTTITFTNGVELKKAPIGFSWTTFFFGGIPALIRQDWAIGIGLFVLNLFTWGLAGIIAAFFYNKIYATSLIRNGFYLNSVLSAQEIVEIEANLGIVKMPTAPAEKV